MKLMPIWKMPRESGGIVSVLAVKGEEAYQVKCRPTGIRHKRSGVSGHEGKALPEDAAAWCVASGAGGDHQPGAQRPDAGKGI